MIELPVFTLIRSRSLSRIYWFLLLLIVALNLVYSILAKKYLLVDNQVNGYFTMILDNAHVRNLQNESVPITLDRTGLSYCQSPGTCAMVDEMELLHSSENKAFVSTRTVKVLQRRNCDEGAPSCNAHLIWFHDEREIRKSFSVMPESFVLLVEHSLGSSQVHQNRFKLSNQEMRGKLLYSNGSVALLWDAGKQRDLIPLSVLLEAAGIRSLDELSDLGIVHAEREPGHKQLSYRQSGVLLELAIHYTNTESTLFGTSPTEYEYIVQRVPMPA